MGLFSRGKCPIHKVEYSIGKDYMCQPYLYCSSCFSEARARKKKEKESESEIELLKSRIEKLEQLNK